MTSGPSPLGLCHNVPLVLLHSHHSGGEENTFGVFSVMRLFRILRVVRLLSSLHRMEVLPTPTRMLGRGRGDT